MARKPTLTTLGKLAALAAEDPDAAPELRAHMLANLDAYAALFGVSPRELGASVAAVPDAELGAIMRKAVKEHNAAKRGVERIAREDAANVGAAEVARTALYLADDGGRWQIDTAALRAALATGEPGLRLVFADHAEEVDAARLRAILAERADAKVYFYPRTLPVIVTWGRVGAMRLVSLTPESGRDVRVVHMPMTPAHAARVREAGRVVHVAGPPPRPVAEPAPAAAAPAPAPAPTAAAARKARPARVAPAAPAAPAPDVVPAPYAPAELVRLALAPAPPANETAPRPGPAELAKAAAPAPEAPRLAASAAAPAAAPAPAPPPPRASSSSSRPVDVECPPVAPVAPRPAAPRRMRRAPRPRHLVFRIARPSSIDPRCV